LARLLDDLYTIPGTNIGVGLDVLMGLVPGFGDVAGTALSGVILLHAVQLRVPLPVLARMGLNLLIDALISVVPVVGDVADIGYRANRKNVRLLEAVVAQPDRVRRDSVGYLIAASAMVVGVVAALLGVAFLVIWGLLRVLGT
jgi:hypothetical protein